MKILIAVQDRLFDVELATFLEHYSCNEATEICLLHAIEPAQIGYGVDLQLLERTRMRAESMMVTGSGESCYMRT